MKSILVLIVLTLALAGCKNKGAEPAKVAEPQKAISSAKAPAVVVPAAPEVKK